MGWEVVRVDRASPENAGGQRAMYLNVFTQCSPSPQLAGLWRYPGDLTANGYRSLRYWTGVAQRLEAACIDALFFADTHGVFDVYRGSWAPAVRDGVQTPAIDPVLVIPAAAAVTTRLGFAVTYSTTYHPPYECARLFSSLDHLTEGRIAWNVVTSFLSSAGANGLGQVLSHDERYDRADEYLTVVRKLWEESWDAGAVVRNAARSIFTDASKVREIAHDGTSFKVRGPHQCEPSPQRVPVLYQAGSSGRGMEFAARHAEVVFMTLGDPQTAAVQIADLRARAAKYGRAPESLKILHGGLIMLGESREQVRAKAKLVSELISAEGEFAKWSGWAGFDIAAYPDDAPLAEIRSEASRSALLLLECINPDRQWTIADLRSFVSMGWRPRRRHGFVGTPDEVADDMEKWLAAGVDGFNLLPCPPSEGIQNICDLLVPELQRRGRFRRAYNPREQTLRERYFGPGQTYYGGAKPAPAG
jgi:FMN-dependent oxidoreductase (nitrilotriacetate monooxygenase family)